MATRSVLTRRRVSAILAVSVIASLLVAANAHAIDHSTGYEIRRLRPVADATVLASRPSANFGRSPWLRVLAGHSKAYLKFRLPPHLDQVSLEVVLLYLRSPTGDGCLEEWWPTDVFITTDDWSERTITWSNAPPPVSYDGTAVYWDNEEVWFETTADVTTDRTLSWVLEMPPGCTVLHTTRYRSSEQPSGRPYVEVWYATDEG
jgi:hypothetical protein